MATIELKNRVFHVSANTSIRCALLKLDLPPHAHLIIKDGKLVTDDEMLQTGDAIELIPVISGG